MNKRLLAISVAALMMVFVVFLIWRYPDTREASFEASALSNEERQSHISSTSQEAEEGPGAPELTKEASSGASTTSTVTPQYQMTSVVSSNQPVVAEERKDSPFRMFASGGTGKVVDREGNIVLQSDPENAIFKIEISPNQKRFTVHRGSGRYDIITPSTGETIRLPQQPPGDNVLGFASWHWIDDQTLLGVSGKTIPFRDDQVGPGREEPIISRSVLYLYDLKEQKMSEIALPLALRTTTVSVSGVDETGKVQLRPEGHEISYTDATLGWFEVRPKE